MHAYAFQNRNGLTRDDVDDPQLKTRMKENRRTKKTTTNTFRVDIGIAFPISTVAMRYIVRKCDVQPKNSPR